MKHNKVIFSVILVALALLIGGAYFLYNQLEDRLDTDGQFAQAVPSQTRPSDSAGQTVPDNGEGEQSPSQEQNVQTTVPDEDGETVQQNPPAEKEDAEQAAAPPDFTVYDAEGSPVTLSQMWEKPVVLNFWGEFCPPCKAEMPHFETIYNRYGDQVNILMVNSAESAKGKAEQARAYIEETGYTFPVYYDSDYQATWLYGVESFPTTFFMTANGESIYYHVGRMTEEMLEIGLELIGVILEEE